MKNKCNVEMENYEDAIFWFETDIINSVSIDDSVYSMVDLSDTYILMAADSNQETSIYPYTGTLIQFKPKDREEYVRNRDEWINLLFKDKVYIHVDPQNEDSGETSTVEQNIPNPFSSSTDISFTISGACKVIVNVTNLIGQKVQTHEQYYQKEGEYTVTIDLSGKPDGIYFINFYANQKEIGKIKALKSN